ncbi:hypothetical protein OJF2_12000 [Aquisphaera giovannonii]|uniref:Uncharacterized protein n=1 Tax=Aquisphaera giovannonii TaxID=406548 RepID=A0A5B9VXV1_9BACT|nr:hypothetical protein [Aquisphaera giovannonii]QEH32721.1 hypothetical protein OJF2_12000 [Aquisphaera giovannonii]
MIPLRNQTIRTATLGFLMWLLLELTHVDLRQAQPQWLPIRDLSSYGLLIGSVLTRAIASIMLGLLCGLAFAASGRRLREAQEAEYSWQAAPGGLGDGRR